MNIRCERCSTTYELDETLLAPEGSTVQCTKCQHVFTAVPPRSPGRTLVGTPAAPGPHPVAPPRSVPQPSQPAGGGVRSGPAIYKRSASPPSPAAVAARGAKPQRDTMGAFEARLKANARMRWLIPLVAAIVALVVVAAFILIGQRVDPAVTRRHAEAMALVALDDIESLEKASKILEELSRGRGGIETVEADLALTRLLLATGLKEDVSVQSQRLAAKLAERDRAAAAQPPPAPEALAPLSTEVEALRVQVDPKESQARSLTERAYGTLKQLAAERGGELAVARALAIHFASIGDREQALRFIRAASGAADRDPWILLAEAWLDAREEAKEPRERAVGKLGALTAAHPEIVRARFLLARTQAALGKKEAAAATLDGLLAVNPRHGRASRLRSELVGPASPLQPTAAPAGAVRPAAAPVSPPAPVPGPAAQVPAPVPAATPLPPRAPPSALPAGAGGPPPAAQARPVPALQPAAPTKPAAAPGVALPAVPHAGAPVKPAGAPAVTGAVPAPAPAAAPKAAAPVPVPAAAPRTVVPAPAPVPAVPPRAVAPVAAPAQAPASPKPVPPAEASAPAPSNGGAAQGAQPKPVAP